MTKIALLFCFIAFVVSFNQTFDATVSFGKPFTGSFTPTGLYGDVTVEVVGSLNKELVVCLQELTNLPFTGRYSECTVSLNLNPTPSTTAATTAAATTGAATTGTASTTGAATTGAAATTAAATTGAATTAAATTAAATTAAATTAAATTAAATTAAATTGAATTGDTTTGDTTTTTGGANAFGKRTFTLGAGAVKSQIVTLRNVRYSIGIYYKTANKDNANERFTLKLSGLSCPDGKTGENCASNVIVVSNATKVTLAANTPTYLVVNAAAGLNTLALRSSLNARISARYSAAPYGTNNDGQVTGNEITVRSPTTGVWFYELLSTVEGATNITLTPFACPAGTVGNGCKSSVVAFNATSNHAQTKFNASQVIYYTVEGPLDSLIFSARTVEKSDKQPRLFAGWNRVPQFDGNNVIATTFDLSGCNVESCKFLNQLNLRQGAAPSATNGTWYVAVQAQDAAVILVWSNYVCPANCTEGSHGTCQTSGDNFGVCQCQPSYDSDLLCSSADFLVEYIILIVIAALVAISAIIGLVAWAYMKSKHRGYEPV